jgi:hypothetical protein
VLGATVPACWQILGSSRGQRMDGNLVWVVERRGVSVRPAMV